jgi:hypothetical protein
MCKNEMKNFFRSYLLFFLFLGINGLAFAQEDVISGVKTAFKSTNSKEVAKYFGSNLELIIEPESVEFDNVSDTQAELVLKNFFQKHPIKDFNWDGHQGSNKDMQYYRTGTYNTATGKFMVFMVLKPVSGGKYMISKLYIQK